MALTDLTRISTSGIATGTSLSGAILHGDAHFRGTQVGVTSALFDSSQNELNFKDNVQLTFGNATNGDLRLYHDGIHSHIFDNGSGDLRVTTNGSKIDFQKVGGEILARFITDGSVDLYYNNSRKFQTSSTGAIVTGIITASKFSGSLVGNTSNASGISTFYDLRVSNNLTVEGTTTTLDTNLVGVDRVEVGANSNSIVGVAITQSGTADILRLYDGASQVVTVDDVGKVGIGSAIPDGTLTVHGPSGGNPGVILRRDTGGGDIASIRWASNSSSFAMINYRDAAPHGLQFYSGGTASSNLSMIIRLNGNVGIGSDIPTQKLDVNGIIAASQGLRVPDGGASSNRISVGDSEDLKIYHNQNDSYITDTGTGDLKIGGATRVDIGNSDLSKLYFRGTNGGGANLYHNNSLKIGTYDSGLNVYGDVTLNDSIIHRDDTNTKIRFPSNDTIAFETAGNERLRITSGGQVNIGGNYSQSNYNLSAYESSNKAALLVKGGSSSHSTANIWCYNDTNNWLALGVWGSAANTSGLITANDGLVGANNDLCIYSTNASGNVKFGAGSGYPELMRLTSSGNLNITGDLTQTSYVLSVTNSSNTNLLRIKTADQGDYDLRFNIQNSESHMWHYGTDDFVIGNRYDRKLHLITNAQKRLTIHGSYIGINQTAPQTTLQVNGSWVNSYGTISVEGGANALVGLGLRSNGNYRGSLIWRDGSSGNYMDISTYGDDAYDILFRQNGNERSRVTTHGLKITNAQSGNAGGALRINTDYANYGTIIVRDKNEQYTSCLQCENENGGASTENRVYRSVNRNSGDWAGANLEARFHNFRINGATASQDRFTITNNGVRSNGAVSGTVCNSYKANTSYNNYGVFTARDASSANEHNAAFQVENPSNGSDTTNQFMRSVDLSSNAWANAKYSAKSHRFLISGSSSTNERFRIDHDGSAHFGNQTSLGKYNNGVSGCSWYDAKDSWQQGQSDTIGWSMMYFNKIGTNSSNNNENRIMHFFNNGTTCGYINRNGSNTQFATSSDYRLKKDVVALPNGIERVKQLRPVAFKWIKDDQDMEGFLAHEAQEICPYAVSGTKDEVALEDHGDKKKGDMIVQSVDYGEFTPLLTAAMKELIAKFEALEAKVTALEGS